MPERPGKRDYLEGSPRSAREVVSDKNSVQEIDGTVETTWPMAPSKSGSSFVPTLFENQRFDLDGILGR